MMSSLRMPVLILLLSLVNPLSAAAEDALPSDSIYQLDVKLQDEDGNAIGLDEFRGHPVIVTMFYASCPHVCPMLISTIKVTEARLDASYGCWQSASTRRATHPKSCSKRCSDMPWTGSAGHCRGQR